jgi:iron complex outermembrane receptor protein
VNSYHLLIKGPVLRLVMVATAAAPWPGDVAAQDTTAALPAVTVTVTRDAARSTFALPYAVTRLDVDSVREATRRTTFTEMLLFVPGVNVVHRYNPTQDPRISVRGFGARSAFGIRGVRILRDGIPLTVADGQTAVDFLDIETIGAAEVFRGSAGALYGNSSGGVVDFRTYAPLPGELSAHVNSFYADGITRASVRAGAGGSVVAGQGTFTHNSGEGPRDYSEFRSGSALGDLRWTGMGTRFQAQVSWYDAPDALNPGALTQADLDTNRTMADPTNVLRKASKSVQQNLVSLQAARDGDRYSWTASVHGGTRDLENPQSFAIVEFDRVLYGASLRGQYNVGSGARMLRLALGADLLNQSDDRVNFFNCAGRTGAGRPAANCPTEADKGVVTLDQRERVRGLGAFARAEFAPLEQLAFTGTLRSDRTRFSVDDHRATDPDLAHGSRTLSAVTPMVGVNWRIGPLMALYANLASSFETPTTTELANQPDGSGGMNRELKPQHGTTYEVGFKGVRGVFGYDLSVFHIETKDELIPFEIPGGGGRRFFRNAGRTTRDGAEAGVSAALGALALGATATFLTYEYDEFEVGGTSFNGKRVPGVTPRMFSAHATFRQPWWLAALEAQHVARLPANDANTDYADAYTLLNARVALSLRGRVSAQPVIGTDNLLDETYAANVVVNATGGRYFEPGPGRVFYVGLRLNGGR